MKEDWQFCFSLSGLVAPTEGIQLDDLYIIGFEPSHNASIFIKAEVDPEKGTDKERYETKKVVTNFFELYSLVTGIKAEIHQGGSSASKISEEHPFGHRDLCKTLSLIPVFEKERREKEIPILKRTAEKFKDLKAIFGSKSKQYLKNALDYYYRSLGDELLEEKIIDLMISLESLFSNEKDELGLRYSLRASFLLSVGNEDQKPTIFRTIHTLYKKRSTVVHGTGNADLTSQEILALQGYVREAIRRMVYLEMSKQDFLFLLDESVYDKEKFATLEETVKKTIRDW